MRSRIFSSKYIKTVSKGQAWIPAFLTLGFILAFPVIGLEKLGSWRNLGYTQDQITLLYYRLWKDGFVLTGMAVAMAAGFMNAVNGFLYLYSRKKTNFYHSLPMKRSELFAEKAVMGLIYYLVSYIVIEFLTVCVGAARGLFSLELMGMAVKMLCLHLLVYLMIYFSVVLVLCITGNMLMGILTLGGIYLYGIALELVLAACGLTFLDTFIDKRYGIMAFLLKDASPAAFAFSLAESEEAGLFLAMAEDGRKIFVMGHPEYDRVTLDGEYKRDLAKGLPIEIPKNYYKDDDPNNKPMLTWRAHANNLYTNWLNYYVYQSTPYDLYGAPDFREI